MTNPGPDNCRRLDCTEPAIAKGLCNWHWVRWYRGVDQIDLPTDEAPAPPRLEWVPPRV
jgi:hypothetical protein